MIYRNSTRCIKDIKTLPRDLTNIKTYQFMFLLSSSILPMALMKK